MLIEPRIFAELIAHPLCGRQRRMVGAGTIAATIERL